MSIASAITSLQSRVADAYTSVGNKGGTIPQVQDTLHLPAAIASIPSGGASTKFGASIDDVFKTTTANDETTLELWGGVTSLTFTGVTSMSGKGLYYGFYENTNITSVSFPDLTIIDKSSGTTGVGRLSYAFNGCTSLTSASFPELTTISGNEAAKYAFYGCTSLTSASFPELTTIGSSESENYTLQYAFGGCTSLTSVSFPKLTTVIGSSMQNAFNGCTSLTSASFPELTTISSNSGAFYACFNKCTNLTSVTFPKLQSITKTGSASSNYGTFQSAFGTSNNQTSVTSLSFPALTSIVENNTSSVSTFKGNVSLTRIDFPVLTTIKKTNAATSNNLPYMFDGCTNLVEIHFGQANQSVIEASDGYATKWGAPNANCQVYFDLT